MLKEKLNNTFLAAKILSALLEFKNSLLRSAGFYSVSDKPL